MQSYEWIMYAGALVWAGIGLYVAFLGKRQADLARRIARLSALMEDKQ